MGDFTTNGRIKKKQINVLSPIEILTETYHYDIKTIMNEPCSRIWLLTERAISQMDALTKEHLGHTDEGIKEVEKTEFGEDWDKATEKPDWVKNKWSHKKQI